MNTVEAIILGAVQGLTEFLPVSSSGHLVLFQNLLGLKEPLLAFDISVHVGTLFAVVIYFFKDIIGILKALARWLAVLPDWQAARVLLKEDREIRIALLIITGSIPTAILGLLFKEISYGIPGGRQPALATTIEADERWRIVAYVKSLGKRE